MSWRDDLGAASFRDVPFFVEKHETELGRRVQLHEYPLRDRPYAEDLGRKARTISVDAYVLGLDYMSARNALIRAVEEPGPGRLVHPYLGELRCTVTRCKLREGTEAGGLAHFALEFVESGAADFPSSLATTGAAVAASAAAAVAAAKASFAARHSVALRPQFVTDASGTIFQQAFTQMQGAVKTVQAAASQVAVLNRDLEAANRNMVTLLFAPASAGATLAGALQQLVSNVSTSPRDALGLARVFYGFGASLPAVNASTTSRKQQAVNQAQIVRLVRVTAAAEGAVAASSLSFDSYQDAVAVRDELVDTLDAVMTDGADDDTYEAARALRAAVVRDITSRGANLARVVAWTPPRTLPALVLAQRLYADASRSDEVLTRNRVRHPLFVPGGVALEVLSDAV